MNLANKISLSRILMIPFFVASLFLFTPDRPWMRLVAVGIFFAAMIADFADGLVARLAHQETQLGKALDPLADKLLLLNAFIWIYHLQSRQVLPLKFALPFSVVFVVISRDVIILLGMLLLVLFKTNINFSPNMWGKLTTLFQMLTISGVLVDYEYTPIFWTLAIVFTLISAVIYIKRGVNALNGNNIKNTAVTDG